MSWDEALKALGFEPVFVVEPGFMDHLEQEEAEMLREFLYDDSLWIVSPDGTYTAPDYLTFFPDGRKVVLHVKALEDAVVRFTMAQSLLDSSLRIGEEGLMVREILR